MEMDLITKQDLERFKIELIDALKEIIKPQPLKEIAKSKDVQEILS